MKEVIHHRYLPLFSFSIHRNVIHRIDSDFLCLIFLFYFIFFFINIINNATNYSLINRNCQGGSRCCNDPLKEAESIGSSIRNSAGCRTNLGSVREPDELGALVRSRDSIAFIVIVVREPEGFSEHPKSIPKASQKHPKWMGWDGIDSGSTASRAKCAIGQ